MLGLLQREPLHGHELHRIVRAHGALYADLKKANLYHLLDRLRQQGYLRVRLEAGTRGRTGERRVYALTAKGRRRFEELLRSVLRAYATVHAGVEVAAVFLSRLPRTEAISLLEERRTVVRSRRSVLTEELGELEKRGVFGRISAEHMFRMTDAELDWIEAALEILKQTPAPAPASAPADH